MMQMDRVMMMKMQLGAKKFHRFYIYNTAVKVLQVGFKQLRAND
jgi:hypothetical protein